VTDAEHPPIQGSLYRIISKHAKIDRPLEKEQFIEKIEILLNRTLKLKKAGVPPDLWIIK